jgi:hypothetical protein
VRLISCRNWTAELRSLDGKDLLISVRSPQHLRFTGAIDPSINTIYGALTMK